MDVTTIITAVVSSVTSIIGAIGGLEFIKWLRNRKADARKAVAEADKAEADADKEEVSVDKDKADYAEKIIEQADERVKQALDDRNRAFIERDKIAEEAKRWREKFFDVLYAHHETKLNAKDLEGKLNEADWHRCEVNGCTKRVPPRTRSKEESN